MSTFQTEYLTLLNTLKEEAKASTNDVYKATLKTLFVMVKKISDGPRTRKDVRIRIAGVISQLQQYRHPKVREVTSGLNNLYTLV